MVCSYGCGQEAKFYLKTVDKWCCNKSYNSCEVKRKKNGEGHRKPKREKPDFCEYGCGKESTYQLKNGKWCCEPHQSKCSKTKKNISTGLKGVKHTKRIKPILLSNNTNIFCNYGCNELAKYYFSKSNKYCCCKSKNSCEEEKRKNIELNKGKNTGKIPWNKGKFGFLSEKAIVSKSKKLKEKWKDPAFLKKQYNGRNIKPNKPENLILEILNRLKLLKWKYTGDYSFWINGKNPDFTNENEKKVIEFFGEWWHGKEFTGKSEEENELDRIKHFEKEGYKVLVIWENRIKNKEDIERMIIEFNE